MSSVPRVRIADAAKHAGETVEIAGWLYNLRKSGKIAFPLVRDGSGIAQAVVFKKDVSPEVFEAAKHLTQESSIIITGSIRADERAPGIPGGFEIGVSDLQVVQIAAEYPITPKEHGVEFLMDNRHLWLRSSRQWAIQRVRSTAMRAMRAWLDDHGCMEVSTPIITPAAAEGTTTLFPVEYFEQQAYLAQTGQLYNEADIFAFKGVYCFGPTFRAEKSKTRRHLTEFWMIEPEIAYCDLDQLLEIEEQFVSHIVQTCLKDRAVELKYLGRDLSKLENIVPPFPRIRYDEAVERLQQLEAEADDAEQKALLHIEWGDDFGAPHETEHQPFAVPVLRSRDFFRSPFDRNDCRRLIWYVRRSVQWVAQCPVAHLAEVITLFSKTALEICEGQQYDMDFETRDDVSVDNYLEMIRLKTAVLLACALKSGAIIGGATAADADLLYQFGEKIGLAFQLMDDLLDVYGDPAKFGKAVGGDITCNKKTFMLIKSLELANTSQKAQFNSWLSKAEFDRDEKVRAITTLYNEVGIKSLCEEKINLYYKEAINALNAVNVDSNRKAELLSLSQKLMCRES